MGSQVRRWISFFVMCIFFASISCFSFAADDEIGYYACENGRFSLKLAENGICYWYQDGERYAGKYKKDYNVIFLEMVGSGNALDTDFQAKILGDGSLSVNGGIVSEERFVKAEKAEDALSVDQLWSARIGKKKSSTGKISIDETILLDWEDLRITATGYLADGNKEAVRLLVENSGNDKVQLELTDLKINGRSVNPFFYEWIGAREKKKCSLDLDVPLLEAAGIDKIETISVAFDVEINYKTVFSSELVSIPVQDNRNRVSVLIPIQKSLLSEYHLYVALIGYVNSGTSIDLYYYVQNDTDNDFKFCFRDAKINGEGFSPYSNDEIIKSSTSEVYCKKLYKADNSQTGTLKELELNIELEENDSCFAEFRSINMEFESSGQLCGYACDMETYTVSDFWQENLVQPDKTNENKIAADSEFVPNFIENEYENSETSSNDVNRFFSANAAEAFDCLVRGDRENAKSKFRYNAIIENDPVSKTVLALRFPYSYTDEQIFELLNEAAAEGYAPAIYSLGFCYEQGIGVEKDEDKSKGLFIIAAGMLFGAENNVIDPEVAYTLGQCYEFGDGDFEKDDAKAASCYAHAAMHGEPAGATNVGKMIFMDRIESNAEDMASWFALAKDSGDPEGTFWYAVMVMMEYAEGDVNELMKTAADGGSVQAKLYLEQGTLYIFE